MDIDLSKGKITLVVAPTDLRYGYYGLAKVANEYLKIDVTKGNDWVVFVSKQRCIAKIIHCDEYGSLPITRKLHLGRYQQLLLKAEGQASKEISVEELQSYLNGKELEVKRTNLQYN